MNPIVRRRLVAQRLVGPKFKTPRAAVAHLAAVQAQDYAGAKSALALRVARTSDRALDRAFAAGEILRTHMLRPTWHFVTPEDIRWLLLLTGPRVHAANSPVYRREGIDASTIRKSERVFERELANGAFRTRDELRDALGHARVEPGGTLRMAYVLMHAELEGLVCSGPRRGRQFTYAWLDDRVPRGVTLDRAAALTELSRRYFTSRGPATVHDFARWSGLTVADARAGIEAVRREFETETIDGATYHFAPDLKKITSPRAGTVHLLSVYDEYISGYKDRSAIGDPKVAAGLQLMENALNSVIAVDGRIVGAWNRDIGRAEVVVSTRFFEPLPASRARALQDAIRAYGEFLGLPAKAARAVSPKRSGSRT